MSEILFHLTQSFSQTRVVWGLAWASRGAEEKLGQLVNEVEKDRIKVSPRPMMRYAIAHRDSKSRDSWNRV